MRRSLAPLVILVIGACSVLFALWFLTSEAGKRHRAAEGTESAADASGGESPLARAELEARTRSASADPTPSVDGPASLTGKVLIETRGSDAPATVNVLVRPSRFMKGRETAVARDLRVTEQLRFSAAGLPYGAYQVRAVAEGYTGAPLEVRLDGGARKADLVVRLRKNPNLTGFVRDATRAPVEKARVLVEGTTGVGDAFGFETSTGPDGAFTVPSIPDGTYTVRVGPVGVPLRKPTDLAVRDGEVPWLVIDVPILGSLEVRVEIPGLDLPLEGVYLTCIRTELDNGGEVESALSDAEGRVVFRNLLPGAYSVTGTREYFRRATGRVRIAGGDAEKMRLELVPELDELIQVLYPRPLESR